MSRAASLAVSGVLTPASVVLMVASVSRLQGMLSARLAVLYGKMWWGVEGRGRRDKRASKSHRDDDEMILFLGAGTSAAASAETVGAAAGQPPTPRRPLQLLRTTNTFGRQSTARNAVLACLRCLSLFLKYIVPFSSYHANACRELDRIAHPRQHHLLLSLTRNSDFLTSRGVLESHSRDMVSLKSMLRSGARLGGRLRCWETAATAATAAMAGFARLKRARQVPGRGERLCVCSVAVIRQWGKVVGRSHAPTEHL